ncbi:PTS fructose transporter subunit IIA [Granulicatella sp. zg-ZJ]|uniref:PTS sugar transporter subunit IIA n=1 Tax=unclassified Granulicatella TaxID=2630493 RepID=UPI0013C00DEB|nr:MULTISPECIES: PTS fructose transporter subunit IIA [unclassified Granulicatella]NEW62021.1 PTS fructose transporter subunit IIA [Granulicatella sp. zg-ZJ]NEW66754.1 PTS fructose transporter subunit IIA [Granulicatella sp. zg-84]QMI85970.1 PTS fructose transporter subunit IIA [Carnobacteriaceae bacterium zg-84]
MSKHLILISHGVFCEALKASTEMIMGPQDYIHAIPLLPSEGPEDFQQKFEALTDGLEEYTVFADLMGGTPCNVASRLLMSGAKSFDLYAGMSMPMVIGFINSVLVGQETDLIANTKENICYVNALLQTDDDDDE